MDIKSYFGDKYVPSMVRWITNYFKEVGYELLTNTAEVLASVEEEGAEKVREKYVELESKYITDYKLFTDFVMQVNMLSWAHDKLREEGFDNREEWIKLYSNLYYQARDLFYDTWENDDIACDYYFEKTD